MYKVDAELPYMPGKVGNRCLDNISRRNLEMLIHTDCKCYPASPWYPDLASLFAMLRIPEHIQSALAQPLCKPAIPSRWPHPSPKLSHFPQPFLWPFHTETPLATHSCSKSPLLSIFFQLQPAHAPASCLLKAKKSKVSSPNWGLPHARFKIDLKSKNILFIESKQQPLTT